MPNLIPTLLPKLEAARFAGLDAIPQAVYPGYHGYSLANIPASVCHWLGVAPFGIQPLAKEILEVFPAPFQHVILLLVDGLGLNKIGHFLQAGKDNPRYSFWNRLVGKGLLAPLTSIVPSTTTAALTTLWTGRTPAEHGVIGYEMYLKEYQMNANMILHSPAAFQGDPGSLRKANFNPETFLPVPTLGPHLLAQGGVNTYAFQHMSIARSGLSNMLFPGVTVIPYRSQSDLWVTLPEAQRAHAAERSYTYIYWGELDELSHRFGPEDPRVELEFANFTFLIEYFLEQLSRQGRGDTLFLVTADHGHLHTPRSSTLELKNHPELYDYLHLLPSGENRFAYLFARPGCEEKIKPYLEQALPGRFSLLPSEQVRQSGLMGARLEGKPHPRLAERMGEFVLIAQDQSYLWWADKENPLLGRHGGLSHTEMLIPFMGMVI